MEFQRVPVPTCSDIRTKNHNIKLVKSLTTIANRKGITVAQLCIAWLGAPGDQVDPFPYLRGHTTYSSLLLADLSARQKHKTHFGKRAVWRCGIVSRDGRYIDGMFP